jgi:hypothetical protein
MKISREEMESVPGNGGDESISSTRDECKKRRLTESNGNELPVSELLDVPISEIMNQIHPEIELDNSALTLMQNILMNILKMIAIEIQGKECEISILEVALKKCFNDNVAKYALQECTNRLDKYEKCDQTSDSLEKMCGLVIPVEPMRIQFEKLCNITLDNKAAIFITTSMEYITAEILELSGNIQRDRITNIDNYDSDSDSEELKHILKNCCEERKNKLLLAPDVMIAITSDEEIVILCDRLDCFNDGNGNGNGNVNSKTNTNVSTENDQDKKISIKLISSLDNGETLIEYHSDSKLILQSILLNSMISTSGSVFSIAKSVTIDVPTSTIEVLCKWLKHDFQEITINNPNSISIWNKEDKEFAEKLLLDAVCDPVLTDDGNGNGDGDGDDELSGSDKFALLLSGSDYLQINLLQQFITTKFHINKQSENNILKCLEFVPHLSDLMDYKHYGFATSNELNDFFKKILNIHDCDNKKLKSKLCSELTWKELQLCDGLYLANKKMFSFGFIDLATSERNKREEMIEKNLTKNTKKRETIKDKVTKAMLKELEKMGPKPMKSKWKTDDDDDDDDDEDGDDGEEKDIDPDNMVYDEVNDPFAKRRKEINLCYREHHLKELDKTFFEAVAQGDLDAAKKAHAEGACPEIITAEEKGIIPFKDLVEKKERWSTIYVDNHDNVIGHRDWGDESRSFSLLSTTEKLDSCQYATPLMIASLNNDINMMNWLLDIGCDVNLAQPSDMMYADGYGLGGFSSIYCATKPEAMELLLSRGADVHQKFLPPQYEENFETRHVLSEHLKFCKLESRDDISRLLIRYGADGNLAEYPCHDCGQDSNLHYRLNTAPTALWPEVVASGDIAFAREMLEYYDVDPNWPGLEEADFKILAEEGAEFLYSNHSQLSYLELYVKSKQIPPNFHNKFYDSMATMKKLHRKIDGNKRETVCKPSGYEEGGSTFGLGANVLQIAILKQDVAMVNLLIDYGADVNNQESVWIGGNGKLPHDTLPNPEYRHSRNLIFWIPDKETLDHYFKCEEENHNSWEDFAVKVKTYSQATPLSVAIATGNQIIIDKLKSKGALSHKNNAVKPIFMCVPAEPSPKSTTSMETVEEEF